jgi:hypothetical protein
VLGAPTAVPLELSPVPVTTARWVRVGAFLAAIVAGTWIISPRFLIDGPSLVDDWAAISRSPHQVSNVGRLLSADGPRFRPGWVVWNYAQWHSLGAPAHMLGPNAWGVLRLLVFVVGVALFTAIAFRIVQYNSHAPLRFVPALVVVAPLIVVTTPKVAGDFARFGPQEPLMVGSMALGGSLLILGVREVVSRRSRHRTVLILAFLTLGYALWAVGIYQKEVSVCVLILVPFLYLACRRDFLPAALRLTKRTRLLLAVLVAGVLLPVAHMALEVTRITARGQLVYGTHVGFGAETIRRSYQFLATMPDNTGSYIGWLLFAVIALAVVLSFGRRKPDWLLFGLLLTALVCLAWSAQTEAAASRYYIPTLSLAAVGFVLVLARIGLDSKAAPIIAACVLVGATAEQFRIWSTRPGLAASHEVISLLVLATLGLSLALARHGVRSDYIGLGAVCVLVALSANKAHRSVELWADDDQNGAALVAAVTRARDSGCPIVVSGVDPERTVALPILSSLRSAGVERRRCSGAFLVLGPHPQPEVTAACPPHDRERLHAWVLQGEPLTLLRCNIKSPRAAKLFVSRRVR